ncbi:LysR substrate-binding domain-containing protein [Streptomyces sp. NPDC057654]|uniref:LysR substrate-binding domain-containing protein n=1 Tax=Streptomyces sp. NPDC057654 TaxID=3346196 RepID=UPI003676885F
MRQSTGLREITCQIFHRAGVTPAVALEAGEVATIVGLVGSGLGVSVVPAGSGAAPPRPDVRLVPLAEPDAFRGVGLLWRRDRPTAAASATSRRAGASGGAAASKGRRSGRAATSRGQRRVMINQARSAGGRGGVRNAVHHRPNRPVGPPSHPPRTTAQPCLSANDARPRSRSPLDDSSLNHFCASVGTSRNVAVRRWRTSRIAAVAWLLPAPPDVS